MTLKPKGFVVKTMTSQHYTRLINNKK